MTEAESVSWFIKVMLYGLLYFSAVASTLLFMHGASRKKSPKQPPHRK